MIRNHHSRAVHATVAEAEALLATLGSDHDAFWPRERWPAMKFKEGPHPGSEGGHGPIRYIVEHRDARNLRFRFTGPRGFEGWHGVEIAPDEIVGVRLIHRLHMEAKGPARLAWPLAFRWLHDACVEDALDKAQAALEGKIWTPRPLPGAVRLLRAAMGLLRRPRPSRAGRSSALLRPSA